MRSSHDGSRKGYRMSDFISREGDPGENLFPKTRGPGRPRNPIPTMTDMVGNKLTGGELGIDDHDRTPLMPEELERHGIRELDLEAISRFYAQSASDLDDFLNRHR